MKESMMLSVERDLVFSSFFDPMARETTEAEPALRPIARLMMVKATGKVNDNAARGFMPSSPTKYVSTMDIDITAMMPNTIGALRLRSFCQIGPSVISPIFFLLFAMSGPYSCFSRFLSRSRKCCMMLKARPLNSNMHFHLKGCDALLHPEE